MSAPRFWAEGGMIASRFMDPMTVEQAVFHLEQVGWLAVNDTRNPETFVTRWVDLVRAIREAQAMSRPVEQKEAA